MGVAPTVSTSPQQAIVLLEPADRVELDLQRNELMALALPDAIASPQEYQAVAEDLERVDRFVKRAKPAFDEVCDGAYKAWKSACNLRSLFFNGLEEFSAKSRRLLGTYRDQQDRIRREDERRIQAEERERLEAAQRAEAAALKANGQADLAATVLNTPIVAPVVTLPTSVPVIAGLSYREDWKWRPASGTAASDFAQLVKVLPREYLKVDDVKLNGIARNMKGTLKVPGVEFFSEKVPVRRG